MTRNWDIIQQGDWIIIKMPSGNQKLIQLQENVQIELGKFGKFQSSELIGKYYSVPLEIYDRDKLKRVENNDYLLDFEIDPRVETDATNQEIFDDSNSQKLTQKQIEEMKLKSLDGSVHHQTIIKEIVSNNEKFNEKTEFAKAKYIKRKNPEKIHELRIDSLSQILTFANVRAGSRMLVCDDTGGLLATAILERTHGHGTCYFLHDGQNASLEIVKCSNFPSNVLSSFKTFAYQNVGKQPDLREIEEGVEVKPELVAKISARNANLKETYSTLEKGGFDSLIISSKFDTTELIRKLEPLLAPSAIVVAYSARKEVILEAYEYCRKSPSYANTFLTESWLREYQVPVFTSGTHPNMMMSGSGGFIFSATTVVTPEGLMLHQVVALLAIPASLAATYNLFPTPKDFLFLPKNSPNITARNQQLALQRLNFIDGPGAFTIANQPGYFSMPNGPQFTPVWYQLTLTEIGEISYRSNASAYEAEQLIPYDLVAAGIPVATLNDLTNMYNNFTSAIHFPYSVINWQADASFGQDRLSWGGYSLKAETSNVLAIPDATTTKLTGCTFAQLLAQKRIFKVDYSTLGKYSKSKVGQTNPFAQSIPGTYLNLYLDTLGNPYPLAIKVVDTGLIYTPLDAPEDWMFAKLAFSTSEGFFLPMEHFIVNHMSIIAARVELMRQVSTEHPVYALLSHHYKDSYGNIIFGVQALLQNGTAFDTVYGCGGLGAARYVGDRALTYNFTTQKINNWFTAAGTSNIPNYKYKVDLLAIRAAVGQFVQNYLGIYYKSDSDVQKDPEIQAWAANTASPTGGNIVGFPKAFTTVFSLADTIADLIVFMTAQHNVMNGEATWDGQTFPAHPHSLYGPYPTKKGIASSRAYLAPVPQLIAAELALHSAFLIPTPSDSVLGFSYGSTLGVFSGVPIFLLQAELTVISVAIQVREASNPRKFLNLDPAQIPFQVWI
ncbi:hypothetical protein HDV01_006059 [Terramyces sp. JEL0728]|nr:hypothetical protein HDV01_006059 [Terramyces sp. JEL0728]